MILEALSYGFMQKALIAGIAVGLICSFMGTFLVLRRYSLFGDGIAHVAFGGISVGLFLGCLFHLDGQNLSIGFSSHDSVEQNTRSYQHH